MVAYYNEFDPFAAEWLRKLIAAGHIAPGDVDERSITEVQPDDLRKYTQCHFFAGIGGWSYAMRLAGWPDDRPVWTGSCPCQPFSSAGKQAKQSDERHLWPHWYRLISECSPTIIFGEQVASAVAAGWWDDVAHDLEAQNYACAAAILPACAVGAPHRRDRLWFVANAYNQQRQDTLSNRCSIDVLQNESIEWYETSSPLAGCGSFLANPNFSDVQGQQPRLNDEKYWKESSQRSTGLRDGTREHNEWAFEPNVGRVAHGIPNRVGLLRGFGNAIVPQEAAQFIISAEEAINATI